MKSSTTFPHKSLKKIVFFLEVSNKESASFKKTSLIHNLYGADRTVEVNCGTLKQTNRQNRLSSTFEQLLKTFCNLAGFYFRATVKKLLIFSATNNHNRR
jgi:hypothetical protein